MFIFVSYKYVSDVLQGHYRCLKLLLSKGANWKEKDKEGETALHLSTRHRSSKCLSLLKSHLAPGEVDDQDNNKVITAAGYIMVIYNRSSLMGLFFHRFGGVHNGSSRI